MSPLSPLASLLRTAPVACLAIALLEGLFCAWAQTPGVVRLNEILANSVAWQNTDRSVTDWIELHNPANVAVDLADASLTDNEAQPRRFVFPPGSVIPGNGFRLLPCVPAAAGSLTNTGFGLKQGGGAVFLFDTVANGGRRIDAVAFGPQAADWPIGRVPNGGGAWTLVPPSPGASNTPAALGSPGSVRINEWRAKPRNAEPDFLELYNTDDRPVRLSGMYLTDDSTQPDKFQIGALSFIGTGKQGGFALFIADDSPASGLDHLGFRLRESGERIVLSDPSQRIVHSVQFGPQVAGGSEGFLPDGSLSRAFFHDTPSPGAFNRLLVPITNVVINELLTHTDPPLQDAIEFRNPTGEDVDMGGWRLLLEPAAEVSFERPATFVFPSPSIVRAGGFLVLYESQLDVGVEMRFNSAHGGKLVLSQTDAGGNPVGFLEQRFGPARNGVSFGWYPTTGGGHDFVAQVRHSFGEDSPRTVLEFARGRGLANAGPLVGPVVISEILYHPPDTVVAGVTNDNSADEYVELRNISTQRVALYDPAHPANRWRLRDAIDFLFPPGASLAPSELVVVVPFDPIAQPAVLQAFRARHGMGVGVRVFGPFTGVLNNNSDSVELVRPDPPQVPPHPDAGYVPFVLVDKVNYADTAPWPTEPDGTGASLQRRNLSGYGNEPTNWIAGAPSPGLPNALRPQILSVSGNRALVPGSVASFSVTASGTAPLAFQWSHDGIKLSGAMQDTLVLDNVSLADAGAYRVRVGNGDGTVESVPMLLQVDTSAPVVSVSEPKPGARLTNSTVLVRGSARDELRLVGVGVSVNGGPFASSTPGDRRAWTFQAALVPGTNVIQVKAVDGAGNESPILTTRVVRAVVARVSIQADHGLVTPIRDGALLELGRDYTVTAAPAAGYLFSEWITAQGNSASATVSFRMEANLVLEARFLPNPFLALSGVYNGLFQEEQPRAESSGFVTFKLSPSGAMSGSLQQGNRRAPFSGVFTPSGHFTNTVTLGTNRARLTLHRTSDEPAAWVRGGLETARWSAEVLAVRGGLNPASSPVPAPFAGSYTVIVPGTNELGETFAGDGFGSLRADGAAMVSFTGTLPDGSKVSRKQAAAADGSWPLYLPLDAGAGCMLGWISVGAPGGAGEEVTGRVSWFKPATATATLYPGGLSEALRWRGGRFQKPVPGPTPWGATNAWVILSGGGLEPAFTNRLALSAAGKVTDLDFHGLTLTFVGASGFFNGTVTVPGVSPAVRFHGAIEGPRDGGSGFFTRKGSSASGRVRLAPVPQP